MTPMIEFTMVLLESVALFLAEEPVIYLYGTVLFCFILKAIKTFA